ncbi:hypothetical protein DH2020_042990 [Rehmannia glutinosa]|uniref:Phospholipid scramblase n=1 Tax=Rehmannia glutinosa TaxID=99300 RepID=A0ABR0ULM7_REHGL
MTIEKDRNGILRIEKRFSSLQQPGGYPLETNTSWRAKLPCCFVETVLGCKGMSRRYVHSVQNDPDLSRDFFVRLWIADRKKPKPSVKARHNKVIKSSGSGETFVDGRTLFGLLERSFSGASVINEKSYDKVKSNLKQPPTSQSVTGTLEPISLEESKVAPLLARSNLLITRDIEWANLVLGFEQLKAWCPVIILILIAKFGMLYEVALINCFKKFVEVRGSSSVVYLCCDEMYSSFLEVQENRYAIVDVCYPQAVCFIREQSNVIARQLLRLRRPFIAYITDGLGNELFRIFTDAGQYVIRFGSADSGVGPATGVQELNVTRSLTLSERAVAVALAVSLDNDYFSRHGGWNKLSPYVLLKKFSQNFVSDDDSTAPSFGRS